VKLGAGENSFNIIRAGNAGRTLFESWATSELLP
jgi:hypothetical protein